MYCKLLLSIISLGVLGCANPSMEDGLESLTQSLAELEASMIALDVEGMLADLSEMQGQAEQMALDVESIEQASSDVQDITSRLNWQSSCKYGTSGIHKKCSLDQPAQRVTSKQISEGEYLSEKIQGSPEVTTTIYPTVPAVVREAPRTHQRETRHNIPNQTAQI